MTDDAPTLPTQNGEPLSVRLRRAVGSQSAINAEVDEILTDQAFLEGLEAIIAKAAVEAATLAVRLAATRLEGS